MAAAVTAHVVASWWIDDAIAPLNTAQRQREHLSAVFARTVMPTAAPEPVAAQTASPDAAQAARAGVTQARRVREEGAASRSRQTPKSAARAASAASAAAAAAPAAAAAASESQAASAAALAAAAAADAASAAAATPADAQAAATEASGAAGSVASAQAASGAGVAAASASMPASSAASASAAAPSASAPAGRRFAWPASTHIEYTLSGNVRGDVHGSATVDWIRQGSRYEVDLEVFIGPRVAPLASRRLTSTGAITPQGLEPASFDQETRPIVGRTQRSTMALDGDTVVYRDGRSVPRPPRLQDTASQFLQIIWLFNTRPELARVGASFEFPLLLPTRLDPWVYDVTDIASIPTPAGNLPALHVVPRRPAAPGNLTAQMWFAPNLQYLPVRIRIEQDAQTWLMLDMTGLPKQALEPGDEAPAGAASSAAR